VYIEIPGFNIFGLASWYSVPYLYYDTYYKLAAEEGYVTVDLVFKCEAPYDAPEGGYLILGKHIYKPSLSSTDLDEETGLSLHTYTVTIPAELDGEDTVQKYFEMKNSLFLARYNRFSYPYTVTAVPVTYDGE
jgi:hypothetical protein